MDLDAFWKQFLIECREHIEIIESHLISAEQGDVTAAAISELFRAFHSIKGLSKSMDLLGIENVAHVCEDILGMIREGQVDFSEASADLLLQGVDCIKNLVEESCTTHANVDAPAELLHELRHYRDGLLEEVGQNVVAAVPAVPVAPPEPEEFIPYFTDETSNGDVVVSHDEDTVHYFLEALVHELSPLLTLDPDKHSDRLLIQNSVNTLRRSYVMMGFDSIMFGLEDILYCVNNGIVRYFLNLSRVFTDLHQIILNNNAPLLTQNDNPVFPIEKAVLRQKTLFLMEFISSHLMNKDDNIFYNIDDIQDVSLSLGYSLSNAFPDLPVAFFLELEVVLSNIELHDEMPEMHTCLEGIVVLLRNFSGFLSDEGLTHEAISDLLNQATDDINLLIPSLPKLSGPAQVVNPSTTLQKTFVETLGDDILSALQKRFKEGGAETIYVLLTYLEADQSIGEKFAMFATKQCELPINRSVFIDSQNWYEFLIIYKEGDEAFTAELKKIDADQKYLILNNDQTAILRDLVKKGVKHLVANDMIVEQLAMPEAHLDTEDEKAIHRAAPTASTTNTNTAVLNTETIRIPGDVLDKFMNNIGEMVLACSHLNFAVNSHSFKSSTNDLKKHVKALGERSKIPSAELIPFYKTVEEIDKNQKNIIESNAFIHSILRYLQESALNLRVIPLESVFKRLPRIVRDVSKQLEKKINLVLEGQEVRIDKSMVDTLVDPLIHMLRNSIDHGIEIPEIRTKCGKNEVGIIRIVAVQQGNQIRIDLIDDGAGLDPELIRKKAIQKGMIAEDAILTPDEINQLIFHPGFSTAAIVTEVSGRGVGMDVVKSNVTRVGGSIQITSKKGEGTKISLRMPLSAAIQEVLIVKASEQTLAIPSRFITEIIEVPLSHLTTLKGQPAILLRDHFLPVSHLGYLLGFVKAQADHENVTIVVLSDGQSTLGIHVDQIVSRSEIFMKDVHQGIVNLPGVGGASILGDGRVVLVLDGEGILELAMKSPATPYVISKIHHENTVETAAKANMGFVDADETVREGAEGGHSGGVIDEHANRYNNAGGSKNAGGPTNLAGPKEDSDASLALKDANLAADSKTNAVLSSDGQSGLFVDEGGSASKKGSAAEVPFDASAKDALPAKDKDATHAKKGSKKSGAGKPIDQKNGD